MQTNNDELNREHALSDRFKVFPNQTYHFQTKKYMQYYLAPVNERYIYLYMTCGECERDDAKR